MKYYFESLDLESDIEIKEMEDNEEVFLYLSFGCISCTEDDPNTHADGAGLAVDQKCNKDSDSIEPQHE